MGEPETNRCGAVNYACNCEHPAGHPGRCACACGKTWEQERYAVIEGDAHRPPDEGPATFPSLVQAFEYAMKRSLELEAGGWRITPDEIAGIWAARRHGRLRYVEIWPADSIR